MKLSLRNMIFSFAIIGILIIGITVGYFYFRNKENLNLTDSYKSFVANANDILYGDVNGDGAVDNKDVVALFKYLNQDKTLSNSQKLNADVYSDGDVNNKDLIFLFKHLSSADIVLPYTGTTIPNNVIMYGDVNEDGQINNKDYVLLYKHINGTSLLTGKALINADLDNSGEVNNKDFVILTQRINGLELGNFPIDPIDDVVLYGDINEDGQIDNKDYVLLSKHVNGTSLLTGKALENADLDASGEVNNKDLSLMYSVVSSEEYQGILPYRPITDNNSEIYEIKYYSQGQWFGSDHKNYGIGLQITSDIPEWSHHIFKGWNTEEDGTGYDYAPESMYTKDENVSLYAQWEIEKYKITYNGNGNTGGTTDQTECEYNTECTLNANGFIRTGYDFDGWYSAATGGTKYGNKVTLTENITVYAHWKTSSLPDIDEVSNYVIVDEDKVIIPEKVKSTELVLNEGYKADYTLGAGKTESIYVGTGDTLKLYATSNPDNYKDYTVVILGDANGDGVINSGDLYYIQSHLIYKKTLEGVYLLAANANKDNTINSGDLYAVQSYLLGKSTL